MLNCHNQYVYIKLHYFIMLKNLLVTLLSPFTEQQVFIGSLLLYELPSRVTVNITQTLAKIE